MDEVNGIESSSSTIEAPPHIITIQYRIIVVAHAVNRNTLYLCIAAKEAWHRARTVFETVSMRWSLITAGLLTLATQLGHTLENAVMPDACVFCGLRQRPGGALICAPCYSDLPWINKACRRCACPLVADLPADVFCAECQKAPPPFELAIAPLLYAFPVDAAIKAMKFKRKLFYAPAFAHILIEAMHDLSADIDALLPVPLHWRRQASRGFNQAGELARAIRKTTGLPLLDNVRRHRATPFQSGLVAAHRQRNLRAAFKVRRGAMPRHVLIVDDVITTGETCRQLAITVLDAGAEKISVLAIARA